MVHRESFINKIRELDYHYKKQQLRTQLWKKKGSTQRMFVPLAQLLEDDYVIGALRQAGVQEKEIRSFLSSAKS
jgi:hypothetical protein